MNGVTYVSTDEELRQFLEFPYRHYNSSDRWIPPLMMEQKKLLNPKKNPFFNNAEMALFLAEKNGRPAGRIAAIIDHRFNEYHSSKTGFFGFYEAVESPEVTRLLFRIVTDWLKERGMTRLMGPANPGMMDEIGILVDGFEHEPCILMPWHKPFYNDLLLGAGLEKAIDLYAYEVTDKTLNRERIDRAVQIVHKRISGLQIRPVNLRKMKRELKIIRHIYNEAWKNNWGFIPLSQEELEALGKDLKMIVDTKYAHIAEINGKPVAFSIALPDFNQVFKRMDGKLFPTGIFKLLWHKRKIDRIRTALMGVLPEHRGKGIDALLHHRAIENGLSSGVYSSELSWILESNVEMIRVAEKIGGRRQKTYRMYQKEL